MSRDSFTFALLALSVLLWVALAGWTFAHEWYSGLCCDDQDCAPIPTSAVSATAEGFQVDLPPGMHFMAPFGGSWLVPYDSGVTGYLDVEPSQDEHFHLCIYEGHLRCLYVPGMMG